MRRLLCVALVLAVAGCATKPDKIRLNAYRAFGGYVTAQATAAAVVTNKAVPADVVIKIQKIVKIATPAAEILYKDLTAYAELQDQIAGVKAAGGTPTEQTMANFAIAQRALIQTYTLTLPKIAELVEAVADFKVKGK